EGLVREGRIAPEALLPPVREVARALQVSPGTAAAAYKALRAQGVVITDGRRGTRVLPRASQHDYAELPAPPGTVDLQVANPDPRLLPDLRRIFAKIRAGSDVYGGSHFDEDLLRRMRAAFEADGVDGSHLVVMSGAIAAIYRALRVCLGAGEKVAVEDPGFIDDYASLLSEAPYHDCLGGGRARWLAVRSFNKVVSPELRVAVAAADAETADRLRKEQWLADGWISGYLQRAAAGVLASRSVL